MKTSLATINNGALSFSVRGRADDPITKHHLETGTFYELDALIKLRSLVNNASRAAKRPIIVDAGANIGNHTLFLAASCPDCGVYSFEMNPETFTFLEENIKQSGLANIHLFNYGLSSRLGTCGIKTTPSNPLGGAQLDLSEGINASVTLETLDHWAETNITDQMCILIKMDVEGQEYNVLRGGVHFIETHMPMVYAELKDLSLYQDCFNLLSPLGYVVAYAEAGDLPNF